MSRAEGVAAVITSLDVVRPSSRRMIVGVAQRIMA